MKRLKQHWIMGPMSWLLSAALVLPAWLIAGAVLLAAPRAAQAQTLNRAPLWAVVDFGNTSGYGGNEIGVQASDGFVVELSKTNKYDVVSRSDTEQAIANDDLVTPLDGIGLQKLSRDLNADAVATGTVASVSFSNNPRRATVSVVIEVVDRISGELINGAVAEGTSTPRPIPTNDDDALVDQAIENADFNAVKQISNYSLPRATVLIHEDPETVTLNKGSQDGYFLGLNLLVTRNGTEVGRLQVSQTSADECYARVIQQGLGIQPQDVCTAIYQLPTYSIGPDHRLRVGSTQAAQPSNDDYLPHNASRNLFTGSGGLLVALGAAVGLVALATNGHGSTSEGGNAIGGGRTGGITAALDQNDPIQNLFLDPFSNAAVAGTNFVPLRIHVVFDPGQLGGNPSTIQYHIYRNPQPQILTASNFGAGTLLDDIGDIPAFSPASPNTTFDSASDLPAVNVYKPYSVDDHQLNNAFFYGVTTATTTGGTGTTTGTTGTGTTGTTATDTGVIPATGLNVGDRVQYSVEGLYDVPDLATGTSPAGTTVTIGSPEIGTTNTNTTSSGTSSTTTTTGLTTVIGLIYSLSELVYSNYVTYLQPVILRSTNAQTTSTTNPATGVTTVTAPYPFATSNSNTPTVDSYFLSSNAQHVVVTVDSVYASGVTALDYALEFSTDPSFGSNVARYTTTGPNGNSVQFREGTPFSFGAANLAGISQFQNATAIYVRVGVRDMRNGGDENSNPYLWSTADPNQGLGGEVPAYLLPINSSLAATTAARTASLAGTTVLTPKFTFIPHRQSVTPGVDSPAIQVSSAHPWMTPSETPHATAAQTAHPTAGGQSGGLRPTHH